MTDDSETPNEIIADAREKAEQKKRLKKRVPIAVGIGSAALTAALMYASRRRSKD